MLASALAIAAMPSATGADRTRDAGPHRGPHHGLSMRGSLLAIAATAADAERTRDAGPCRGPQHRLSIVSSALVLAAIFALGISNAHAERPLHGSVGAGGSFLTTGSQGDRWRLDVAVDLKPRSRYGFLLAWRAFDEDHRGLVTAGLVFEGAAARPRLVLDLHADIGADLDQPAPLVGGGLRVTLGIKGPLALVYDGCVFLVLDGIDDSRLQLQSTLLVVARW